MPSVRKVSMPLGPKREEFERQWGVTGVVMENGLVHVAVTIGPDLRERLKVFRALAEAGVSLFLIKFHPDSINFVIRKEFLGQAQRVLGRLHCPTRFTKDCTMVSILSSAMRDLPGVMAKVAEAVYERGVELLEAGDSHDTVMLLIRRRDARRVVKALREKFGL